MAGLLLGIALGLILGLTIVGAVNTITRWHVRRNATRHDDRRWL